MKIYETTKGFVKIYVYYVKVMFNVGNTVNGDGECSGLFPE